MPSNTNNFAKTDVETNDRRDNLAEKTHVKNLQEPNSAALEASPEMVKAGVFECSTWGLPESGDWEQAIASTYLVMERIRLSTQAKNR